VSFYSKPDLKKDANRLYLSALNIPLFCFGVNLREFDPIVTGLAVIFVLMAFLFYKLRRIELLNGNLLDQLPELAVMHLYNRKNH